MLLPDDSLKFLNQIRTLVVPVVQLFGVFFEVVDLQGATHPFLYPFPFAHAHRKFSIRLVHIGKLPIEVVTSQRIGFARKQGHPTCTIGSLGCIFCQFPRRSHKVVVGHRLCTDFSSLNNPFPLGDEWHPNPALKQVALHTPKRAIGVEKWHIVAEMALPVVAHKHDQCVFGNAQGVH